MKELEILKEIGNILSNEIDNRSTVLIIKAKILDYRLAVYERAFKEASDIVSETFNKKEVSLESNPKDCSL